MNVCMTHLFILLAAMAAMFNAHQWQQHDGHYVFFPFFFFCFLSTSSMRARTRQFIYFDLQIESQARPGRKALGCDGNNNTSMKPKLVLHLITSRSIFVRYFWAWPWSTLLGIDLLWLLPHPVLSLSKQPYVELIFFQGEPIPQI